MRNLAIGKLFRGEEANEAGVPVMEALHRIEKMGHKSSTSSHCLFSLISTNHGYTLKSEKVHPAC